MTFLLFLHELIPTHPLHPRAQFRLNMMPPFASRHSGRQSRSPSSEQEQGQERRHVHGWAQAGKRMRAQRDAGRGPVTDAAPGCPAASPGTYHCYAPRVLACRALREAAGPARIARTAKSSCWQVVSALPRLSVPSDPFIGSQQVSSPSLSHANKFRRLAQNYQ